MLGTDHHKYHADARKDLGNEAWRRINEMAAGNPLGQFNVGLEGILQPLSGKALDGILLPMPCKACVGSGCSIEDLVAVPPIAVLVNVGAKKEKRTIVRLRAKSMGAYNHIEAVHSLRPIALDDDALAVDCESKFDEWTERQHFNTCTHTLAECAAQKTPCYKQFACLVARRKLKSWGYCGGCVSAMTDEFLIGLVKFYFLFEHSIYYMTPTDLAATEGNPCMIVAHVHMGGMNGARPEGRHAEFTWQLSWRNNRKWVTTKPTQPCGSSYSHADWTDLLLPPDPAGSSTIGGLKVVSNEIESAAVWIGNTKHVIATLFHVKFLPVKSTHLAKLGLFARQEVKNEVATQTKWCGYAACDRGAVVQAVTVYAAKHPDVLKQEQRTTALLDSMISKMAPAATAEDAWTGAIHRMTTLSIQSGTDLSKLREMFLSRYAAEGPIWRQFAEEIGEQRKEEEVVRAKMTLSNTPITRVTRWLGASDQHLAELWWVKKVSGVSPKQLIWILTLPIAMVGGVSTTIMFVVLLVLVFFGLVLSAPVWLKYVEQMLDALYKWRQGPTVNLQTFEDVESSRVEGFKPTPGLVIRGHCLKQGDIVMEQDEQGWFKTKVTAENEVKCSRWDAECNVDDSKGYHLMGIASAGVVNLTSCYHNTVNALCKRHLVAPPHPTTTDFSVARAWMRGWLKTAALNYCLFENDKPTAATARKLKEQLNDYWVGIRWIRWAFVKIEKYTKWSKARLIQALRDKGAVVHLKSQMVSVQKSLKHTLTVDQALFDHTITGYGGVFASGLTSDELGLAVKQVTDFLGESYYVLSMDASCYDACQTFQHLELSAEVGDALDPRVGKHIRTLAKEKAGLADSRGQFDTVQIRYKVEATMRSGDNHTTWGNTVSNLDCWAEISNDTGIPMIAFCAGDDSLVFLRKGTKTPQEVLCAVTLAGSRCGLQLTGRIDEHIKYADFLSGRFFPVELRGQHMHVLVPKVGRLLARLWWSKAPMKGAQLARWRSTNATGLWPLCQHVPILRQHIEHSVGVAPVMTGAERDQFFDHLELEQFKITNIIRTEQCFVDEWFHDVYGLHPVEVDALSSKLKQLGATAVGILTSCEAIKLAQADGVYEVPAL